MSFGQDLWCDERGLMTARYATGPTLVAQAIFRRLTTTRGTLSGSPEEEVYGLNVSDLIGARGTEAALTQLPALIRAEVLKDDRVYLCNVNVARGVDQPSAGLVTLTLDVDVTLFDAQQSFTLTLAANALTVEVLR